MRRLIIFDFFGVISSEVAPFWLERYFNHDESVSIKADIVARADVGEITAQEMFTRLGKLVGESADLVQKAWSELAVIDREMVEFISELKQDNTVVLLSNAPAEYLRGILDDHSLTGLFERIIISSEVHITKPDSQIYQMMLDTMGMYAENAVMIDDNPVNLAGAESVGIRGIQYSTIDALKNELR